MPITARLSSRFYEKLGDDIADDLVAWLNAVDAQFREQLKEANDANWDRFRGELGAVRAELDTLGARLTGEFKAGLGDLRAEMHQELGKQLRWMFGFWATTLLAIAGLKLL